LFIGSINSRNATGFDCFSLSRLVLLRAGQRRLRLTKLKHLHNFGIPMPSVLILNGPNLNLLGKRQPDVYGHTTLADIEASCVAHGATLALNVRCLQSNHEGVLIDAIHAAKGIEDALIINAGAYTHTSIALMDAVISIEIPMVEVHLSNIHAREPFRHGSYLAKVAVGQICGFGPQGYLMALDALARRLGST
jgi:3-dehydroquinate dehydratase-2